MLHCSHLNERLEFGMESVAILSHSFINSGGRIIPCRTALVDLGINDVDPGLAPEGARCADGSLCVNQKCMPVADLKIGPNACPNNCNGHGICNSKANCHCDEGYAPPLCIATGTGGSVDSGPASHPYSTPALLTFIYVCLVLIPFLLLCAFITYHRRRIWQMSKEGTPEEWRTWMEKANPTAKFMRQSDQEDGSRPSRPTSLLTTADISAPVSSVPYENGQSTSSSPTHALLPRIDTSTSALSNVVSDKTQKEGVSSAESIRNKRGEGSSSNGIFGSLAAGIEKSKFKLRSKSMYASSTKDKIPDTSQPKSEKGIKRGFMESLAKSISLPSPKIRGAMKTHAYGSTKAQYEIKVEHQEQRKDSGDDSPHILTPCDVEDKRFLNDDFNLVRNTKSSLLKDTSKDSMDSIKTATTTTTSSVEVKKVDTTVSVTNSNNLITGSKSLSSFSTNRVTAPYRTTLPASKSYSFRTQTQNSKETDNMLVSSAITKSSSPMKSLSANESSSLSLPSSIPAGNEPKISIKDSLRFPIKDKETSPPSVSVNNNLHKDEKDFSRYPTTKKHAFPHSSTFSGRENSPSTTAFLPTSISCDSAATTTTQTLSSRKEENINSSQNPCSSIRILGGSNNKGINANGLEKEGNNVLVSGKITQDSKKTLNDTTVSKPVIAKKPPTPPRKTSYLKSKEVSNPMKPKISIEKNVTDKVSSKNDVVTCDVNSAVKSSLSSTICATNNASSDFSVCKPQEVACTISGKTPASQLSNATSSSTLIAPNLTTTSASTVVSVEPLSDKQMPLTKTTTVPTSLSTIGRKSQSLPKSSTLPAVQASRPLIGKPILQTATPSAASLIERAPSTGVSQSSILGGSNKAGKGDRSSRGVVFCDPLTLPSPTNPNNPPIIHQQSSTSANIPTPTQSSVTTVSATQMGISQPTAAQPQKVITSPIVSENNGDTATTVLLPNTTTVDFTPTWKTEPKPLSADAIVCNIDDGKGQKIGEKFLSSGTSSNKDASIASPDSDKGSEKSLGQFSKFKSKLASVKRTPTAERHKLEKYDKNADDTRSLSPTSSLRSFDGPPRVPERGNLRNLQISNPILQTAVDIKTNLVPVRRASEDIANPLAGPLMSASISPTPPARVSIGTSGLTPYNLPSDSAVSLNGPRTDNYVRTKGKAPQPPPQRKIDVGSTSSNSPLNLNVSLKAAGSSNLAKEDTVDGKSDNKSLFTNISRRLSNKTKHSERRDSAPEACISSHLMTTVVPNSPSTSSISSQSTTDCKNTNTNKFGFPTTAATDDKASSKLYSSSRTKRPASIATTRPVRPTAPPPPRPPNNSRAQNSPTRSDTSSVASSTCSINTTGSKTEPIYDTIRENPLEEKAEATSITSPLSEEFVTPTSSPILTRRNSDTISTGSSTDGCDLMKEILKEWQGKTKEEGEESVYSTLVRKKKNKMKTSANEH